MKYKDIQVITEEGIALIYLKSTRGSECFE